MATNPFEKQRKERERKLRGLERRYDRRGQPLRRLTEDLEIIAELLRDRVIDRDHADLLREDAQKHYQEAVTKHRLKEAETRTFSHVQRATQAMFGGCMVLVLVAILALVGCAKSLFH